jgi:protein ImuB
MFVDTPRIACIVVSLFPLAARLRSEPELAREAVVIVEGNGSAARVVAASRLARRAGVKPGATLTQARALIPKLVARPRDPECERAAQEALLEVADRFSPRVEDAGDGVAYFDVDGIDRHFPSNLERPGADAAAERAAESGLAEALAGDATPAVAACLAREGPELTLGRALLVAAEAAGLPARAGIASSKLAARVAAGLAESPAAVLPGREAPFLAPLPLARLSPVLETADLSTTLARWGIRTIGDFARLPGSRVTSRLGNAGRELHSTARGVDPRPLMPRQPPAAFHEGTDLEWPLVALEPFLFVGRAALERLCRRLEISGLACARLELNLRLEPDGHQLRTIDLPAPTRDIKTLLTLLRLDLEARPPGAPVAGFTLAAHPDRPREAQLSLYGPAALSPDKLAATLARLFALLGPGRVGSPRPVDGHLPERLALVEYAPPPPPEVRRDPRRGSGRGLLAIRVLRPALPIEVLVEEPRGGVGRGAGGGAGAREAGAAAQVAAAASTATQVAAAEPGEVADVAVEASSVGEPCLLPPLEIQPVVREDSAGRPRIAGRVKVAAGPWGLEDEWWTPNPTGRDYWDVELTTGGIYRIYRERASGSWYADGIYD